MMPPGEISRWMARYPPVPRMMICRNMRKNLVPAMSVPARSLARACQPKWRRCRPDQIERRAPSIPIACSTSTLRNVVAACCAACRLALEASVRSRFVSTSFSSVSDQSTRLPMIAIQPYHGCSRKAAKTNNGNHGASQKAISPAPVRNSRSVSTSRRLWTRPASGWRRMPPCTALNAGWAILSSNSTPARTSTRVRTISSRPYTASSTPAMIVIVTNVPSLRPVSTRS